MATKSRRDQRAEGKVVWGKWYNKRYQRGLMTREKMEAVYLTALLRQDKGG